MSEALELLYVLCNGTNVQIGEVGEAFSRKLSRRRNLPATAEIVLDIDSPMASFLDPQLQTRLKIFRARTDSERAASNPSVTNKLIFYGVLPSENVQDDTEQGITTAVFADPRVRLAQNYIVIAPLTFAATGQGAILNALLATIPLRTWGDLKLSTGVVDNSVLRDRTYEIGTNIAEAIQQMTAVIDGCDVDVIPTDSGPSIMGTFNSYAKQGVDLPKIKFTHGIDMPTNCDIQHYYTQTLTQATHQGVDANGVTNLGMSSIILGVNDYGLLEKFVTESDAYTLTSLIDRSDGVVTQYHLPQNIWQVKNITEEAPRPMIDFDLGDTIRLSVKRGRLVASDAVIRVDGYDLDVADDGRVDVTSLLLVDDA